MWNGIWYLCKYTRDHIGRSQKSAMKELFITKIHIHEVRHLKDFDIPLSETERKHLILTGRNGSGKTSVLEAIRDFLDLASHKGRNPIMESYRELLERERLGQVGYEDGNNYTIHERLNSLKKNNPILESIELEYMSRLFLPGDRPWDGDFLISYFGSKRTPSFEPPSGISKISEPLYYSIGEKLGSKLIQHLVNLKADQAFAIQENDIPLAEKIDKWFDNFDNDLRFLLGSEGKLLTFDRSNYAFLISEKGKLPYDFNKLSDGYSAIIEILSELIMRVELKRANCLDIQGIVLIDEIETHLHIDLQKKILPFLTSFFPKIQFIVTTHSPFVLNSVDNAVICDLEKRIVTTDLSGYSSEIIVESYFGTDKYSQILKDQVDEYEKLMGQETLSFEDEDRLDELESYFETIPKYLSDELTVKLQQIRLKNLKLQN